MYRAESFILPPTCAFPLQQEGGRLKQRKSKHFVKRNENWTWPPCLDYKSLCSYAYSVVPELSSASARNPAVPLIKFPVGVGWNACWLCGWDTGLSTSTVLCAGVRTALEGYYVFSCILDVLVIVSKRLFSS